MNVAEHISPLVNCDLCGSSLEKMAHVVARGEQRVLDAYAHLTTLLCSNCRFIFQGQRFSDKLLEELYANDASFAFGENDSNRLLVHKHLAERQQVISDAMALNGLLYGANVLDIGGGAGDCCVHLVDRHKVVVADASKSTPSDPRINKVDGLFSDQIAPGTFDVAVLNHVLEHVFTPTALLQSTYLVLRPGGIVVVEVPFELFTPLLARHLGDWRHVAYFSRHTLRRFIEKAGFTITRLKLEMGSYDTRRLPVIRAVAYRRQDLAPPILNQSHKVAPLLRDMLEPVAITHLMGRVLGRR
jgi:SAM-dependent methyltransferase